MLTWAYNESENTFIEITDETEGVITTLGQCLALELNESPFYADFGLPPMRDMSSSLLLAHYVLILLDKFTLDKKAVYPKLNSVDIHVTLKNFNTQFYAAL